MPKTVTNRPLKPTIHFEINQEEDQRILTNQSFTPIKTRAQFVRILIDEAMTAREKAREVTIASVPAAG